VTLWIFPIATEMVLLRPGVKNRKITLNTTPVSLHWTHKRNAGNFFQEIVRKLGKLLKIIEETIMLHLMNTSNDELGNL